MAPNKYPEDAEQLSQHTTELWGIIISPFERDIDPLLYQADFTLPVAPNAPFFADQSLQDYYSIVTQHKVDSTMPWAAHVQFVPSEQKLGVSSLAIPLKSPDNSHFLVMHRTNYGFLPFLKTADGSQQLTYTDENEQPALLISSTTVDKTLELAGWNMSNLPKDPKVLQLHMASLADTAHNFSYGESVTMPVDTDLQLTFARVVERRPNLCGTDQVPVYRDLFTTDVQAISEFVSRDARTRKQLVIEFNGEDYDIGKHVTIETRHLVLAADSPATPGLREYVEVDSTTIPVTLETVKQCAADITDSLMGA